MINKTLIITFLIVAFCVNAINLNSQQRDEKKFSATVYTTALNTDYKISKTKTLYFQDAPQAIEKEIYVFVNPNKKFQSIIGIGGSITDASAEVFAKLTSKQQNELLSNFFDAQKGIGYSIIRTNIGSCDFSSDSYSYVADNDAELKTFNISHDEKFKIPLIKKANASAGCNLPLFISQWSPPAWMKDNKSLYKGGKIIPKYYQTSADYFVKIINAYKLIGLDVWGSSVQNEPMATQTWESCIFTAKEEGDYIKNYLAPTLINKGYGDIKLIAWDHNRDLLYHRACVIMNDTAAAKYIWGFGYHWYETWTGSEMQTENIKRFSESFPNKHILFTEGCIEKFDSTKINEWWLGERYGKAMINDFNNGSEGWIDWNILLDMKGGPNHAKNFCYAPVHVDFSSEKLIYTNIFYYQGHFSKFVKPGAKRVACVTTRSQLIATSFINDDGKLIVVVMNSTNNKMDYNLFVENKMSQLEALPHSISTIVVE